jgi:hypothetical protein
MLLKRIAAVVTALVLVVCFAIAHGKADPGNRLEPITYADLTTRPVFGRLGRPLGEIITIEGVFTDGTFTRMKADDGWILLRVQVVNGIRLKQEQVFQYEQARKNSPAAGAAFKFIGYETGGFTGEPAGTFKYTGPFPTTGYGFTTKFIVLRDEMARPK